MITHLGSNWNNDSNTSYFNWNLNNTSSNRNRNISTHLICIYRIKCELLPYLLVKHNTGIKKDVLVGMLHVRKFVKQNTKESRI